MMRNSHNIKVSKGPANETLDVGIWRRSAQPWGIVYLGLRAIIADPSWPCFTQVTNAGNDITLYLFIQQACLKE